MGWLIFVAVTLVCTSCFVPDTLFAVMEAFSYGVAGGTAITRGRIAHRDAQLHPCPVVATRPGSEMAKPASAPRRHGACGRPGGIRPGPARLTPLGPVAVSYLLGTTHTICSLPGLEPWIDSRPVRGGVPGPRGAACGGASGAVPGHPVPTRCLRLAGLVFLFPASRLHHAHSPGGRSPRPRRKPPKPGTPPGKQAPAGPSTPVFRVILPWDHLVGRRGRRAGLAGFVEDSKRARLLETVGQVRQGTPHLETEGLVRSSAPATPRPDRRSAVMDFKSAVAASALTRAPSRPGAPRSRGHPTEGPCPSGSGSWQ